MNSEVNVLRAFRALFVKELRSYFVSPLFYVAASVFYGLSGFFFYSQLVNYIQHGTGLNVLGNFWLSYLAGAPYSVSMVLLLVVPILTMRLFAEEKKLGTIELLLTYPLRDATIVLAKFCACSVVVLVLIAGSMLYPAYMGLHVAIPWTPLLCGYLGLLLLSLSFVSCGLFLSSLTESQVVAGLATLGVLMLFWMLDWNEAATQLPLLALLTRFSMFDRFESFARGVIDMGDLAYFICFVAAFHFLTLRVLESRKWRGRR